MRTNHGYIVAFSMIAWAELYDIVGSGEAILSTSLVRDVPEEMNPTTGFPSSSASRRTRSQCSTNPADPSRTSCRSSIRVKGSRYLSAFRRANDHRTYFSMRGKSYRLDAVSSHAMDTTLGAIPVRSRSAGKVDEFPGHTTLAPA